MKGISPLIATVLLIAFTVSVGAVVYTWINSVTVSTTSTTQQSGDRTTKCATSVLEILEVVSNLSTTDSVNTTVRYLFGEQDIYFFNLTFIDNTRTSATVAPTIVKNFNKTFPLKPGMLAVFVLNLSNTNDVITTASLPGSSLDRVSVLARCQDAIPISAECRAGQSCLR